MVYLVGAGPGDPDLITRRGIECLKQADVVVCDRLVNHLLLAYARHAELIDVGKQPHHHNISQNEINSLLIEKARAGQIVVRLKGGDPFIFGRGGEEAAALAEAGISFEIVPGVSSAIAAPAFAGIPVTYRGIACSVAFATGHRADYVEDPTCDWARLACGPDTLVFLMGVQNLPRIVEQLVTHGRPPSTPVALVQWATCSDQKTVVGTLADIVQRAAGVCPPAVIVIGEVVRLRETLRWFDRPDRRPLLGLHVLNTQPLHCAGDLSRKLAALGAEPVELPTTRVVPPADLAPLDDAVSRLTARDTHNPIWDWIVFSNADCVSFFINRLFALGHDVRALAGAKLAVADHSAAEALLGHGLVADFVPNGQEVGITAPIGGMPGQRILALRPNLAIPTPLVSYEDPLLGALSDRGAVVEAIAACDILPAGHDNRAPLDGLDAATFADPSAVLGLAALLDGQSLADTLSPLTVACTNPATAEAARALGLRVDVVAGEQTVEGLVEALVSWHRRG
jgi:uroporphyrinogen III methyltransferase/synthase